MKEFGRIPRRKKGTSEEVRAENKLAKRFSDHRDSIPNDVMLELQALECATPSESAAVSAALQRSALSGSLQTLVEDVKQFGRIPIRNHGTSEEARAENNLAKRFLEHRESIPGDVMLELQDLEESRAVSAAAQRAATEEFKRKQKTDELLQQVREFGSWPKESAQRPLAERQLAWHIRKTRKAKHFSPEQEAELQTLQQADTKSDGRMQQTKIEEVMQQVRDLGRFPKESAGRSVAERQLGWLVRKGLKAKQFSPEQEAELQALQQAERDGKTRLRIAEAEERPNPMEGFAEEAGNRIDQDLLLLESGIRNKAILRRLATYKELVSSRGAPQPAQHREFAQRYAERVRRALAAPAGKSCYVPGGEVEGNQLRVFSNRAVMTGPLVCQLCDCDFLIEEDFARHKQCNHAGEAEYRKRVLYLMAHAGCRPITAQEKRIMVQNFAYFQQFCHPGSKANRFSGGGAVPRSEAACVVCAQKDYLEHRHKLSLFGAVPEERVFEHCADSASDRDDLSDGEADAPPKRALVKHRGVYYLQSPELVQKLLDVDRYRQRWPLIPCEQLHASSVQHPEHPEWRWLLHSRRVPVVAPPEATAGTCGASQPAADRSGGASQPADERPPCAGVGDANALVWVCWDCLNDLCAKKPKMPLNALVNDNWIGRELMLVRNASKATKMLAPLGRCCWKQVRLGKGAPDVQQKGISGNTILFAQPTAQIPTMELPPEQGALVDSLNIVFSGAAHKLHKAYWATVKRGEYMQIVRERKLQCATFSEVSVREDVAPTRLPEDGVPDHIEACLQPVDGVDKAPVRLLGPASRAPEVGRDDEAGDESDEEKETDKDGEAAEQPDMAYLHENVAEFTVAVDPVHDIAPVRMMQALQGTLVALQEQAARIAKNEVTPTVADSSGALQPVADEGGRHTMRSMVLDVQSAARSFDERAQVVLEKAQAGADACRAVGPHSLSVPTQKPLSSFDSRSWPACYTEFWFGDGAPNLERERPMLFEQVFPRNTTYATSVDSGVDPLIAVCRLGLHVLIAVSRGGLHPLIAVSCLYLRALIAVSRLDLHVLITVSRLDLHPLIPLSRLDLHVSIAVSRLDLHMLIAVSRLDLYLLIALFRLDLHVLIAVSRLDLHALIAVSRLDLHVLIAVSRLDIHPLNARLRLDLHVFIAVSRFFVLRGRTAPHQPGGARVLSRDRRGALRGSLPEPLQLARNHCCLRRRDPPAAALERHSGGDWQERLRH